jgi:hypothetical protein
LGDLDTALWVQREFYSDLLKPRASPVNLIWEINSPRGKKVDEPAMLELRRLATDYRGPLPQTPYIVIGKEKLLAGFIKRYNSYRTMHSDCMHTLIIKYG